MLSSSIGKAGGSASILSLPPPGATYTEGAVVGPVNFQGRTPKLLELHGAPSGDYRLAVIATSAATYTAEIRAHGRDAGMQEVVVRDAPIAAGARHEYVLHFDETTSTAFAARGAANGGYNADDGQLITYAGEATPFPGTKALGLVVFYAAQVLPETLSVSIDGRPHPGVFHPVPGKAEVVRFFGLAPGRHRLDAAVEGHAGSTTLTDEDEISLTVPDGGPVPGKSRE